MKVIASSLRKGNIVDIDGKLGVIVSTENIHPGKGTPVTQMDVRRIADGVKLSLRFKTTDQVERAFVEDHKHQFMYQDSEGFHFMNMESYDQVALPADIIGDQAAYLQPEMEVTISLHEGTPVAIELPPKATLEVVETEPTIKSQTAASSYKPAVLSNGVRTMVPPFVTTGTKIVVMTADGSYVERAKELIYAPNTVANPEHLFIASGSVLSACAAPLGRSRVDSDSTSSRFRDLTRARFQALQQCLHCGGQRPMLMSAACRPASTRIASRTITGRSISSRIWAPCKFDPETLSFAGAPVEQAMCLMRGMDATQKSRPAARRPAAGARKPHRRNRRPALTRSSERLPVQAGSRMGFRRQSVAAGVARARQRSRCADGALFRHPRYQRTELRPPRFPGNIDTDPEYENLADYACSDGWGHAHVFINRIGEMLVAHDYSIPWRETKFEQAAEFGGALQGLSCTTNSSSRDERARTRRAQRRPIARSRLHRRAI